MKTRHILLLIGVAAILGGLAGCSLFGIVSIEDRLATFQTDLNSATRTVIYQNFHPTRTSDYSALKDPMTTIDVVIPALGTNPAYSLSVTDKSDPANGVKVTITGGPAGFGPQYLNLVMDVTGTSDYRILSLELSGTRGYFTGNPQIQ
jgi:hypothetical protein